MNRPSVILIVGLVFIAGTAINAIIPRESDSRRISLGSVGKEYVGSILIPCGWQQQDNSPNDDGISLEFHSHAKAPKIVATTTEQRESTATNSKNTARLLSEDVMSVEFYDASREVTWSRSSEGAGRSGMRKVNVQFHQSPRLSLTFIDIDNTAEFEATLIRIVDSYSKDPADPFEVRKSGNASQKNPPFILTDLRRRYHAIWIVGAMTVLLSLVLIERNIEAKQQQEFQEELTRERMAKPPVEAIMVNDAQPLPKPKGLEDRTDWQSLAMQERASDAGPTSKPQRPTIPFDD